MRNFLLLLLAAPCFSQTVSSITFDGIGDSSARVLFNVDTTFTEYRLRYIASPGSCSAGTGGALQTYNTVVTVLYGVSLQISGLAPSTNYAVCPEVRNGGGAWSTGVESTGLTTTARTQVLPDPPAAVSMTFPAQSGMTWNVMSDCSNLQDIIDDAEPGDTIVIPAGTICTDDYTTPNAPELRTISAVVTSTSTITTSAPHGIIDNQEIHFATAGANANCLPGNKIFPGNAYPQAFFMNCSKSGGWNMGEKYCANFIDTTHLQVLLEDCMTPARPGYITFTANAGADTIAYLPTVNTPGGYQTVDTFGVGVGANTLIQFLSTGTLPGGLSADTDYYLLSACTSSANAACTTQVSLSSGGAAVDITSAGTGTHYIVDKGTGTFYVLPAPTQNTDWILVTTGGTLPPDGVRIDPSYDDQMAVIRKIDYTADGTPSFSPGIGAHNWRLKGIKFDATPNTDYMTTTDPRGACIGPSTQQDNRFIVYDQIRIQGFEEGSFNRTGCRGGGLSVFWRGGYMSVINSDWRDLTYWHPWFGGATTGIGVGTAMVPTRTSATVATLTAGVAHLGVTTVTTSTSAVLTITSPGSSSNDGKVYMDMAGVIRYLLPSGGGIAATCSVTGTTCAVDVSQANPAWPTDANGRMAGLRLFTIEITSGSIDGVTVMPRNGYTQARGDSEGSNFLTGGEGPGPYLMYNNNISGCGLTIHFDDGGATFLRRHDYTITQNTFDAPTYCMLITNVASDGLWYGNRQQLEWKGGQRILVSGNNFNGCFSQSNPNGLCLVMTPISGGYTTDVEVSQNQFTYVNGCIQPASPTMTFIPASRPPQRQLFENNLCLIDAYRHYVPTESQPLGIAFYTNNAMEDVTIQHNTVFNNLGNATAFFYTYWNPLGGMTINDNFYFYTGAKQMFFQETGMCALDTDLTYLNNCFTAGPGNPSYSFLNNVVVPSWVDTQAASGAIIADTTVTNAFLGKFPPNLVPSGANWDAKVTTVDFACGVMCTGNKPQLYLNGGSPYVAAGTGGTRVGIEDWTSFEQALARVGTVTVSPIAVDSATVNIPTPSTFGCAVDYNTTGDFTDPYTRVANAGGSLSQMVALTALNPGTQYFYRVDCATEQPTGSFTTASASGSFGGFMKNNRISGPVVIK